MLIFLIYLWHETKKKTTTALLFIGCSFWVTEISRNIIKENSCLLRRFINEINNKVKFEIFMQMYVKVCVCVWSRAALCESPDRSLQEMMVNILDLCF